MQCGPPIQGIAPEQLFVREYPSHLNNIVLSSGVFHHNELNGSLSSLLTFLGAALLMIKTTSISDSAEPRF